MFSTQLRKVPSDPQLTAMRISEDVIHPQVNRQGLQPEIIRARTQTSAFPNALGQCIG